jgi:hypothetical protein
VHQLAANNPRSHVHELANRLPSNYSFQIQRKSCHSHVHELAELAAHLLRVHDLVAAPNLKHILEELRILWWPPAAAAVAAKQQYVTSRHSAEGMPINKTPWAGSYRAIRAHFLSLKTA